MATSIHTHNFRQCSHASVGLACTINYPNEAEDFQTRVYPPPSCKVEIYIMKLPSQRDQEQLWGALSDPSHKQAWGSGARW